MEVTRRGSRQPSVCSSVELGLVEVQEGRGELSGQEPALLTLSSALLQVSAQGGVVSEDGGA